MFFTKQIVLIKNFKILLRKFEFATKKNRTSVCDLNYENTIFNVENYRSLQIGLQ